MPNPSAIARIVRAIPNVPALADQIAQRAAALDEYAAEKFDINDPAFALDRAILAAMRDEFRIRTGERI